MMNVKYILVIVKLLIMVQTKQNDNPMIISLQETLGQKAFKLADHERQNIKLSQVINQRFIGAYDIQIYKKEGFDDFKDISSFEKVENSSLTKKGKIDGCVYDQRRLSIKENLWIDILTTDESFYSDLIFLKDKNLAFLLRNDFNVYPIHYNFSRSGFLNNLKREEQASNYKDFLRVSLGNRVSKPQGFYDTSTETVYIFTEVGGVQFSTTNGYQQLNFTKFEIKLREIIRKVYFYKNQIYVVSGIQGIDVYKKEQLTYVYKETIELKHSLTKNNLDILDVQFNKYQLNQLYILDSEEGIHIVQYNNGDTTSETLIPIQNALAFSNYKDSFLVAAQTSENISFAVEILYNSANHDYYYNQFYLEDVDIRDIFNYRDFSMLIGYDAQRLVLQNIYQGFTDLNFDWDSEFQVANVEHIEIISNNRNQTYLFALTKNQLKSFRVQELNPKIVCGSNRELQQSYWVTVNSTVCAKKITNNPFELCVLNFQFTLEVFPSLIDSEQEYPLLIGIILVALFLITVFGCGLFLCRRWSLALALMENKRANIRNKKKYNQIEEKEEKEEKSIN